MASHRTAISTPSNTTMFTAVTPGGNYHRSFFDMRSRHSVFADVGSKDEENMDDALKRIVKQTWNIWAVSPLFGLRFDDNNILKQYAKRLREKVAASLPQENVAYEAKFSPLEDLVCNPQDPPALQIQVHSKVDEDNRITCIYNGIFLYWGERREIELDNVKLPILLTRGAQRVTKAVHSFLCKMFDCVITAMPASQDDLMWLSAIVLNSLSENKEKTRHAANHELTLGYQIPGLPITDSIKVKLPVQSVSKLWSKICPRQQNSSNPKENVASVIRLEQVTKLYECIRIQMLDNADLELGYCLLDDISFPSLTIKGNRMKAASIDAMDQVLWFFHEKALLYSPTFTPVVNLVEEDDDEEGGEEEKETEVEDEEEEQG